MFVIGTVLMMAAGQLPLDITCGTPPQGFTYKQDFLRAQKWWLDKSIHESSFGKMDLPIEGVVVPLNGGQAISMNDLNSGDITEQQANSFIVNEIREKKAMIAGECAYRLCQAGRQRGTDEVSLAIIETIGRICGQALGDPQPAKSDLKVVPNYVKVVFGAENTVDKRFRLLYTGPRQSIDVRVPLLKNPTDIEKKSALITYVRTADEKATTKTPQSIVKLSHNTGIDVVVRFQKPTAGNPVITVPLAFFDEGDQNSRTVLHASAVRSIREILPNASIGCGEVQPNAWAKSYGDGDGMDAVPAPHSSWTALPVALAGPSAAWPNNCGALSEANYSARCEQVSTERDSAVTRVSFHYRVLARGGVHRCGGGAGIDPIWRTMLVLPGSKSDRWDIRVAGVGTTDAPRGFTCEAVLDDQKSPEFLLPPGGSPLWSPATAVSSGMRELTVACRGLAAGYQGGPGVQTKAFNNDPTLTITATRRPAVAESRGRSSGKLQPAAH